MVSIEFILAVTVKVLYLNSRDQDIRIPGMRFKDQRLVQDLDVSSRKRRTTINEEIKFHKVKD